MTTDDIPQREMTLDEWMDRLPSHHGAHLELDALRADLAAAKVERDNWRQRYEALAISNDPEGGVKAEMQRAVLRLTGERDAARAEAARLRDEKEHLFGLLVRLDPLFHGSNYDTGCMCHRCVTVREVKAALEER